MNHETHIPIRARSRAVRAGFAVVVVAIAAGGCNDAGDAQSPQGTATSSVGAQASAATSPLDVFVSIDPQKYFVESIGGEHVRVSVLLPGGQSPHTYEPTAKQIVEASRADVYFRLRLPFEQRLVEKIAAGTEHLRVVDTQVDGKLMPASQACCARHHEHGHDHAHQDQDADHRHDNHGEQALDLHTWLSPRQAMAQSRVIADTLSELAPVHRDAFKTRLDQLRDELQRLDEQLAATLAPLRGREFFVYHPAFGYFARDYGLTQVAVEVGGREPTARQVNRLIERAKAANVKLIFVQPQFSAGSAEVVAEAIGGAVVPIDPLAANYVENLQHVAEQIRQALSSPS